MDFLLKRSKNNRDIDLELEKAIEDELKNMRIDPNEYTDRDDMSDRSFISARHRKMDDSFSQSLDFENLDALKELRNARADVNNALMDFEYDVEKMKAANKGQLMEYDYLEMAEKKIERHNEDVTETKMEEYKKQIPEKSNTHYIEEAEKENTNYLNSAINENVQPEEHDYKIKEEKKTPESQNSVDNGFIEQENRLRVRLERAQMDREILQMEKEDDRSMKYEQYNQERYFRNRLYTLPEAFTIYKESSSMMGRINLNLNKLKFKKSVYCAPISNPKENMLETSKTEMDKIILNKITNKKRSKIGYLSITDKNKSLLSKRILADKSNNEIKDLNKSKLLSEKENTSLPSILNSSKLLKGSQSSSDIAEISNNFNPLKWVLTKALALNQKVGKVDQKELGNAKRNIQALLNEDSHYVDASINIYNQSVNDDLESSPELENIPKSLKHFISKLENKDIKALEIKMENIGDIDNIQILKGLRILALNINKIQNMKPVSSLNSLIQVNLSDNNLESIEGLSNLKHLRVLNLEVNRISRIENLNECLLLEELNLNNNQITRIEGLRGLKNLKRLYLFRNKITSMNGIEDLEGLEELDLGRNQISKINPIQNLTLLRKLVLYYNVIEEIPKNFSHSFLSELWLNGNKLSDISNFTYFSSLKLLNLQENNISVLTQDTFMFIPNLKYLSISFNKIPSFGEIYRFLTHFTSVSNLDINENPFINVSTESLKSLYENILINLLPHLVELNSHKLKATPNQKIIDNQYNQTLFMPSTRVDNDIYHVDKFKSLLTRFNKSFYIQNCAANAKTSVGISFLSSNAGIFDNKSNDIHVIDHEACFKLHTALAKYRKSTQKIKSLVNNYRYKVRKLNKYYSKNLINIIKIQSNYKGHLIRKVWNVSKIMDKKRFLNKGKYAIKIQKVFRGHRTRKRRREFFKNLKVQDDELEEFDDSFFSKELDLDKFTTLQVPKSFLGQVPASTVKDITAFLQPPSTYNPKPNYNDIQEHPISPEKKTPIIQEEEDKEDAYSVSSANSRGITSTHLKPSNKANTMKPAHPIFDKQQKEQIMDEWGFQDEGVRRAFEFRLKQQQQRKEKKKPLNAEERFRKFQESSKR